MCRDAHESSPAFVVLGALRLVGAFLGVVLSVVFLAAVALSSSACGRYDNLVEADQNAAEKWADLDAALQRRADLVPNLVAVVKGSAKHEEETLTKVVEARSAATSTHLSEEDLADPDKVAAFQKAQGELGGALSRLLVVQEAYPDLKANSAFHDLQVQLEGTENRILRAREEYNRAAGDYNAELLKVGGLVVNRLTGRPFKQRVYFSASDAARSVPTVEF
ncbi:MAG: LemA family protein [Polyangiaceae bacterium]